MAAKVTVSQNCAASWTLASLAGIPANQARPCGRSMIANTPLLADDLNDWRFPLNRGDVGQEVRHSSPPEARDKEFRPCPDELTTSDPTHVIIRQPNTKFLPWGANRTRGAVLPPQSKGKPC